MCVRLFFRVWWHYSASSFLRVMPFDPLRASFHPGFPVQPLILLLIRLEFLVKWIKPWRNRDLALKREKRHNRPQSPTHVRSRTFSPAEREARGPAQQAPSRRALTRSAGPGTGWFTVLRTPPLGGVRSTRLRA